MNKQALLAMPRLDATRKMMGMAVNDVPQKKACYGRTYDVYEYELFLRAMVQDGILKVALFLPRLMRLGARRPAFELYIDKAARKFLTYSLEKKKWLTGKLDRIGWEKDYWSAGKRWLSEADAKLVREYLGSGTGGYQDILDYQRGIRADELRARHKRETDPWDADLAQVPALPKDWARWVSKVGLLENFIFYQYVRGGAKAGYCTYCEKEVPIKGPRHNAEGRCPRCGRKITFKSVGKAGTVRTEGNYIYLLQQCRDGFVIRSFKASRTYCPGKYETPELFYHEYRRTICDPYGHPLRSYAWAVYRQPTATTVATTKVAYGASKYPNLTSIGYDTYRKLDYKEKSNSYTYFYDFRNTWYAGASIDAPEKGPYSWQPGLYGAVASTNGSTLTYTTYTEIPNSKVKYAKLYTYDMAKAIDLSVSDNKEMTISTTKLPKDDKSFIANAKAFWANEKTGDDYKTDWRGFAVRSANMFSVGSWEKYGTIEAKFADTAYFEPLDYWLRTSQYYSHEAGTIYGH